MRIFRTGFGWTDLAILGGVLVVIAAETAAVIGGLGPIFAVVALGYLLVLGLIYWMYRQARSFQVSELALQPVETVAAAVSTANKQMLTEVDIFRDLTDEQAEKVASIGKRIRVLAGEGLGITGESGDRLFIVIDGKTQLSAHSAIGEITVRIAGPGESFPLAALIGSGELITSASAMTDMELLVIQKSRFTALCAENPQIGYRVYEAIADVLGNRYRRTLAHMTASAERALKAADFWANV